MLKVNFNNNRNIRKPEFSLGSRSLIIYFVIFYLVHLAGNIILFSLSSLDTSTSYIWRTISFLAYAIPAYLVIFSGSYLNFQKLTQDSGNDYASDLGLLLLLSLGLVLLNTVLPYNIFTDGKIENFLNLLIIDTSTLAIYLLTLCYLYFFNKWLCIHKHRFTNRHITLIFSLLAGLSVLSWIVHTYSLDDNLTLLFVVIIMAIFYYVMIFLSARRNEWIALLPAHKKYKILWQSLAIIVLLFVLAINSFNDSKLFSKILVSSFPGLDNTLGYIYLGTAVYLFRLILSTIAALPTTGIITRKSVELDSLTYLNRIISQSIDTGKLLQTVSELAVNSTQAKASWIELYYSLGDPTIASQFNIDQANILVLHKDGLLKSRFLSVNRSQLVESVNNDDVLSRIKKDLVYFNSIIIVPISSGSERIGTMALLHTDEFGFDSSHLTLLDAYSNNISVALENAKLIEDSMVKERYKKELMIARDMQKKLLPQSIPAISGIEISAFSLPAEEVGGDYYDFLPLKNGRTCIIIGDVSGKGMNAAFYMAQLKGVAMALSLESTSPSELLKKINATLYGTIDRQVFITLTCAMVEHEHDLIKISRAGHVPLIYGHDNGVDFVTPKGIGIGLAGNDIFSASIEEIELKVLPGDWLFMFTDGINELRNKEGKEYSCDAIAEFCRNGGFDRPELMLTELQRALIDYSEGQAQHDDMTAIALFYKNIHERSENNEY